MLVLSKGHNIRRDLEELLSICFETDEIKYIEELDDYNGKGILFYNHIYDKDGFEQLESRIYKDGKIVESILYNVDQVEVYIKSQNKKRNISIKKSIINLSKSKNILPWGILTGIRPVKIIHDLYDKGLEEYKIKEILSKEYMIWDEKIDLLISVARRQRKFILKNKDKYSIYISIPFCPSRCLYCSFPSLPINLYEDLVEKYVDMLIYELDKTLEMMNGKEINTVYIGGGTPTSINKKYLEKLIKYINNRIGNGKIKEFTVEAGRPDTINESYLKMLKINGVDRISINPQTMNDKTLKIMGRNHSSKDIIRVYKEAEKLDFDSINMDLIIGLPGEGLEEVEYTLKEIEKLNPTNLTIHTLAVKTGSKFKKRLDEFENISYEEMNRIVRIIEEYTKKNDFNPYYLYRQKQSVSNLENIGYAKDDKFCIYNISMMEERETILGIGMGSVSKIVKDNNRINRVPNFKGIHDYMNRIEELISRKKDNI